MPDIGAIRMDNLIKGNIKTKYLHLPFEEREDLYKWFKLQQRWHSKQGESLWHKNQTNWYKIRSRWLFNLSELTFRTFKNNRNLLADNIQKSNVLLSRLK